MKNEKITYEMDFTESKFIRDEEKGVFEVRNVSLLGQVSKNGYSYATDAMREAVPLYEGVQAFINHPSKADVAEGRRDVRDLAGKFESVRFEEASKRVKGDFVGLPNENGKLFVDIAENMPKIAGTSQNASGRFAIHEGKKVVESITKVFSVDLVANPATNDGIFENENFEHKEHDMEDYTKIMETELRIRRPELVDVLVKEGFESGTKSRDDEVKKLTDERDKAVQEADTLKVEKALAGKSAVIDKMLAESKLPKEAKTKIFKEQLMKVEPDDKGEVKEAVKALIDDRMKAIKPGGVRGMGGEKFIAEGENKGGSLTEGS
jgi:hypothetical protein